ncbi:mCG148235 [Mus musculus]|nr:mCG148235 [Mus musculus]
MREGSQITHCTYGCSRRIPALWATHWAAGLPTESDPEWPKARTLPATGTELLQETPSKAKLFSRKRMLKTQRNLEARKQLGGHYIYCSDKWVHQNGEL